MGQAKERTLLDRCMTGFDRPERAALRLGWRYSRVDNGDEPREDDAELEAPMLQPRLLCTCGRMAEDETWMA
jgi:hypothetical protein